VLTDQALCPFKAFATHRLCATGLELKTPGPDPQDRGNLVHGALAAFWQHLNGQAALLALSDAALTLAIDRAVTTALDALAEITGRVRELEHARLVLVMREWLAFERQRVPFEVEEVESERRLAVGALEFSLRIDRIDRLAGDRLLILDYKTGKTARNEWDLPRPTAPQLLLYALAEHPAPVAAIGFARVHRAESQLMLLPKEADKAAPETDLEDSLAQWRSALTALAEEYMAGEARVDPKDRKTTCRYCELALLCRIREQADTSEEDSDDDA
jgi:RecB family exonuclease